MGKDAVFISTAIFFRRDALFDYGFSFTDNTLDAVSFIRSQDRVSLCSFFVIAVLVNCRSKITGQLY